MALCGGFQIIVGGMLPVESLSAVGRRFIIVIFKRMLNISDVVPGALWHLTFKTDVKLLMVSVVLGFIFLCFRLSHWKWKKTLCSECCDTLSFYILHDALLHTARYLEVSSKKMSCDMIPGTVWGFKNHNNYMYKRSVGFLGHFDNVATISNPRQYTAPEHVNKAVSWNIFYCFLFT